MPQSKHIKKGQTARQWRKKKNLRRADAAEQQKFEKRMEFLKLIQSMENQELEEQAEAEMVSIDIPVAQDEKEFLEGNEKNES